MSLSVSDDYILLAFDALARAESLSQNRYVVPVDDCESIILLFALKKKFSFFLCLLDLSALIYF